MSEILTEIINLLVAGITSLATGIGTGLKSLVESIFLSGTGTTESPYKLSTFGGIVVIFAGVALAFGLCRWVMNFITSLGASN